MVTFILAIVPKKEPLAVANPDDAFKKVEDLTRRLLAVRSGELNESLGYIG
jgi:hypothetical protein